MYIFLDESGQFTKHNHEEYFVVAAFTVGDPRRIEKKFRSWCHTRFPGKMRSQSEIKWSAGSIDDRLRERTLKLISRLDVRIRYVYLLRTNIPVEFRRREKIKNGSLYANIIGELIDTFLPAGEMEFRVLCDQRHLEGITAAEFKQSMEARILTKVPNKALVRVEMIDSTSNANIQIADWIVGALARYHEKGRHGKEYYEILRNNLLTEGKEIFKHKNNYD